jgi:hypothetical protein
MFVCKYDHDFLLYSLCNLMYGMITNNSVCVDILMIGSVI